MRKGGRESEQIRFLHCSVKYFNTSSVGFLYVRQSEMNLCVTVQRFGLMVAERGGVLTGVSVVCCGLSGSVI